MRADRMLLALAAATLVAATGLSHHAASRLRASFPAEDDILYLPSVGVLHRMALGHDELMADLVFMRTIGSFGAQITGRKQYDWLVGHLDAVNALDPHFRAPYRFGGIATMYNGLPVTNDAVLSSNHFLEAGTREFPRDWELAFMLGSNYLNELVTKDPAEKQKWTEIGGAWIQRAGTQPGAPVWVATLAATIMTREGRLDAAVRHLEEAFMNAPDEASRDEIARLLKAKRDEHIAELSEARAALERQWRAEFPYLPPGIYIALGPKRPSRLDPAVLSGDAIAAVTGR